MSDEMVPWLHGVLDELERAAKAATYGPWHQDGMTVRAEKSRLWGTEGRYLEQQADTLIVKHTWPQESAHMVLNDPRSVLARVQAERQLIELHWTFPLSRPVPGTQFAEHKTEDDPDRHACGLCTNDDAVPLVEWPCPTLRMLAYGHRYDTPGFDPQWAPEGLETP